MGRGLSWQFEEKVLLSQAYVQATNDPIKGADQTLTDFKHTFFAIFCQLCEAGEHEDPNRYSGQCEVEVEVEASLGNSTRRSCSRNPSASAAGDDTAALSDKVGCADSFHHSGTPNLMATTATYDTVLLQRRCWQRVGWQLYRMCGIVPSFVNSEFNGIGDGDGILLQHRRWQRFCSWQRYRPCVWTRSVARERRT